MDKNLYKSSFNDINVSQDVIDKVISAESKMRNAGKQKRSVSLRFFVPLAAILSASVITVSAAAYLGASDALGYLLSDLFSTKKSEIGADQLEFMEKNGSAPGSRLDKNGVSLAIEGIIGDSNYIFLKYSVSTEENYSEDTLKSFLSPQFYVGKLHKGILKADSTRNTEKDAADPDKTNISALIVPRENISPSGDLQTATIIVKSNTDKKVYQDMGINLDEAYRKCGSGVTVNDGDLYSLPDCGLNIPFSNEYGGKITLESVGFVGNKLVLGVHSDYYEDPQLFLREKNTGRVYSRCDGSVYAEGNGMGIYPYEIDSADMLKNFEIVMLEEYHLTFPLTYNDCAKVLDIGNSPLSLGDAVITGVTISPLSVRIDGKFTNGGFPIDANNECSIRLKDKTTMAKSGWGYLYDEADGTFKTAMPFDKPVMLDTMEAIVIEHRGNVIEIPVN